MVIKQKLKSYSRTSVVIIFILILFAPLYVRRTAHAYSLPSSRFIKMSSSANGSLADGQDVTYQTSFVTNQGGASSNIGGMVIEFCSGTNGPNIGATCTAPTGFNAHAFTGDNTLVLANQVGITGWAKSTTGATANRVILTRTVSSIATGTTFSIDLGSTGGSDGITNPTNVNTTFYARILTYATAAEAEAYGPTSVGSPVDAGGVALSTAEQITITAKVPEKLTFCIYTSISSNTCSGVTGNSITLGDTTGVLSDTGPFVDKNAKYSITSNALNGVAIRVKGGTLKTSPACSETLGQNCSINAIGATATASAPGTEQFGFCTYQSAGTGITPAAPYNDAACSGTTQTAGTASTGGDNGALFAFDNNNTTGTTSTYGHPFANSVASTFSTGILAFIGNITTTTEAGIYTTTLTFIATGTY